MSETDTTQAETPQTDIAQPEQEQAEQVAQTDEQGADDEGDKPRKMHPVARRVAELTANWRSAERERDHWRQMAMQTAQLSQPVYPDPYDAGGVPQQQPDVRQLARQEAEALFRQQQVTSKVDAFVQGITDPEVLDYVQDKTGNAAFTPAISDAILSMPVDEGRATVEWMARNPDVVMRIAQQPPHLQVMELLRASAPWSAQRKSQPPRVSSAPAPVRPVNGNATTFDPNTADIGAWMKWRESQLSR